MIAAAGNSHGLQSIGVVGRCCFELNVTQSHVFAPKHQDST